VKSLRTNDSDSVRISGAILQRASLGEPAFHRLISLERRRAERSRKSFLLVLVDAGRRPFDVSEKPLAALMPMTRETDIVGWYKEGTIAGVLFTEIAEDDLGSTTRAIMNRVSKTLKSNLTAQQFGKVSLSFHLLPEEHDHRPSSFHAASVAPVNIASSSVAVEVR
jgi:hypothetical protein